MPETTPITQPQEVAHARELDTSVMSLLGASTAYNMLLPVDALIDIARESGYEGIEYHPLGLYPGLSVNHGIILQPDGIRAFHEGFRTEKTLLDALKSPTNRFLRIQAVLTLPHGVSAMRELGRLQELLGRDMDIVMYPTEDPAEEAEKSSGFTSTTYQPTEEVMKLWKVTTIEDMAQEGRKRGHKGVTWDTAHSRTLPGHWQENLAFLLDQNLVKRIHLSAGRIDMGYAGTVEELKDLYFGTSHTELSEMLRFINDNDWTGPVVTEIPMNAIKAVIKGGLITSPRTVIRAHRRIVGNVQSILA